LADSPRTELYARVAELVDAQDLKTEGEKEKNPSEKPISDEKKDK